ncbi:hypothetical protein [Streptomyces sp. ODS28]|uniref:hypothetical protein n=1 Tax=Streptomyces sp. ODS28 TaxID=3136688 RepID=UPI0031E6DB22
MKLPTRTIDGHLLITVYRTPPVAEAQELAAALSRALAGHHGPVSVVDWRAGSLPLPYAEVLFRAQQQAAASGSTLRVAAPTQLARGVLRFAVNDGVLHIHPSLSSALRTP